MLWTPPNDGEVIKVAAGTYDDINDYGGLAQIVYLEKSITIQGGYTPAFTEPPDPEANATTLDAGGKTDIDLDPRPYLTPDLGADEYWPPGALKYIYLPLVVR